MVKLAPTAKLPNVEQVSARPLVPALNIHLLTFSSEQAREAAAQRLRLHRNVLAVEANREVEFRVEPNDERYADDQFNLVRAGFDRAWELTAGGRTADDEEIVVAILDAGFDYDHVDLEDNVWRNPGEVPGDGIDNDGNGYVDDSHGWDMTNDDNLVANDAHGTQVIGVLGAKGNNGRGIAGTNWDLKMMLLSINTTANIVEAYGYVLEQRQRYNRSGGAEGALVVATNASFGIEGGTCEDYPVWGSLYDDLGRAGVLTAASTANRSWDVDRFGDMPTDCPTDYLIGVANLGPEDRLWTSSGYGSESIDLAAPGEGSYSTRPSGTYGPFASTSAAAPYVTGAIALLYATPCPNLLETMRVDPAAAAQLVRAAILNSTTPNPSLEFRTSSGGSLDVAEAQRLLAESCELGEEEAFTINSIYPNPGNTIVTLQTNAIVFSDGATVELYDPLGRLVKRQQPRRVSSAPVRVEIDVTGLPQGWYHLRLRERNRTAEGRVLVERR